MTERILITGPTKSGKSEWAEQLALQSTQTVVYVATSSVNGEDADWQARIEMHRQRRPDAWRTLEEPIALAQALQQARPDECWLVDSLGTWLANCLELSATDWQETTDGLLDAIARFPGTLILVAEETGWGVVPAYPLGRTFRDRLGVLTRQVGAIADVTYLVVAGFAIALNTMGIPTLSKADSQPD
ncbi:bifunctional adenosylcobinamide kinase/adenosylcobinamide-phosphate guanylyltransferase [Oscillatoria sp. CS-180]|uniref:bifunctional adenosylcobinamide kinase/adenosylcobinamide-phosphate guanylyltransferase n=1 Tax=Oscillatoria sp. CS-180 TaxID=3021720 RepID=UPI00232FEDBC|nr:bifunctional adenosylcobinamide kinase/adenosylcobinamide-phosphate guanylyltransferase [Oscillatoria sp. CS-180]MDB9527291.1 bifunctional adenosylcobinamide kinase/adenosylcobinamide-phosphate guanylyltransferase [Oscillatoria sp. CS-180]